MGAYILRRLLLIIPTLIGIMVINFTLTQFVPGGPIEQVLARLEGGGDAFQTIAGGGESSHQFKGLGIAEEPSFGRRKMGLNTRVIARILQRRPRRFLRAAHATLNGARDQHHSQSLE